MNKVTKNIVAALFNEIITVVVGLVLPRLILEFYGSNVNGLVSSITHFLSFVTLCELGIGAVINANLYKPIAEGDVYGISLVLSSARIFFRRIAWGLIVYTVCLAFIYPIVVSRQFDYIYTASLIIIIAISMFAQYYLGITYQLYLNANHQAYVPLYINSSTLLLNLVVSYGVIYFGFGVHVLKLFTALIFVARPILMMWYVKRHIQLDLSIKCLTEPIKQKWNGIAQHISTQVQNSASTIILTLFSSLANVSIYSVYCLVTHALTQIVYTVNAGVSPLLGRKIAEQKQGEVENLFKRFEWGMHTITIVLFVITSKLIVPFVRIYTSGINDANYTVPLFAMLITFCAALRCLQLTYNIVVHSACHFRQTQSAAIIEPLINIVISVLAVKEFGLVGVTLGTAVSLLYRMLYLIVYLHKNVLYLQYKQVLKQFFVDLLVCMVSVFIFTYIECNPENFYVWTLDACKISVITLVVSLCINRVFYREYTLFGKCISWRR